MKKEEFEEKYKKKLKSIKYEDHFVTLPCNCGEDSCLKWAAVTNSKTHIQAHNELYNK